MSSLQNMLVLLASLALFWPQVSAAPSRIQKRSFVVPRIPNENFKGHDGPRSLYQAYAKYSMPIPESLLDYIRGGDSKGNAPQNVRLSAVGSNTSLGPALNGTAVTSATPERGDVEYISPISIAGQTLNVVFDSGSADLWVFNTQLPAAVQAGHDVYDPQKSTTFSLLEGHAWQIRYGDGSSARGNVGTDSVEIGGVTVANQAVELATQVSQSFVEDKALDGLLGLAFSTINTVRPTAQKTWFENVLPQLAEPVFTADIRPGAAGAYEFGRIDESKFQGPLTWVPVNTTNGFWQVSSTTFAVGRPGEQVPILQGNPRGVAIVDTGTTLILAAQQVVQGYYAQVPSARADPIIGGIVIACNETLPDLMLDIGGVHMARVSGRDINFAPLPNGIGESCLFYLI